MDEIEDGELPSSPESSEEPYNPLQRPTKRVPRQIRQDSTSDENETNVDENSSHSIFNDSDDDSVDSDSELVKKKAKKNVKAGSRMDELEAPSRSNDIFRSMAAQFQSNIKKKNNVWGSILQEETLTADMTGIGVSGRNLKELNSDRGAETYDYIQVMEAKAEMQAMSKQKEMEDLDSQLGDYWNRKDQAIQAGRKRTIKDRLGQSSRLNSSGSPTDQFENMSIPPPGVARQIADLNPNVLTNLQEVMDGDGEDDDDDKAAVLGDELASKLSEPKTDLMIGVVELFGVEVCLELFEKTQKIEADGGMMIKNGERRRTPGGVFLQLLRDFGADDKETRVSNKLVRSFFAQSNRSFFNQKKKKPKNDFKADLESFKVLQKEVGKKTPVQAEQGLKPLPDILSCVTQRMTAQASSSKNHHEEEASNEAFVEPDAPPNSVERTLNSYDDDFLSAECETDDIELF